MFLIFNRWKTLLVAYKAVISFIVLVTKKQVSLKFDLSNLKNNIFTILQPKKHFFVLCLYSTIYICNKKLKTAAVTWNKCHNFYKFHFPCNTWLLLAHEKNNRKKEASNMCITFVILNFPTTTWHSTKLPITVLGRTLSTPKLREQYKDDTIPTTISYYINTKQQVQQDGVGIVWSKINTRYTQVHVDYSPTCKVM